VPTTANEPVSQSTYPAVREGRVIAAMIERFLTTTPGGRIIALSMGMDNARTGIAELIAKSQARITETPGPTAAERSYVLELTPLGQMLVQIRGT
jgi:hypothetical protein